MAQANSTASAISALIQSREENITHRANRVSALELSSWTVPEVASLLDQLFPKPKRPGNNEPCGPDINRPSLISDWMFTFVKAPLPFVEQSIRQQAALCVNRLGKFQVRRNGYAVMSHVWGETCGWNTPDNWGPIEPELRKKGIIHRHFLRFFDRCDADWLWVDILAMPEVFHDTSAAEKAETEELRTGVINTLRHIYMRADKVVCLDGLLLRLRSGGMVDVAIVLCLGRWIARLWPFTETKLAKRVVLKTEDSAFDLDEILKFLHETVNNDNHRYFSLWRRLSPLRPTPADHQRLTSELRPDLRDGLTFVDLPTLAAVMPGNAIMCAGISAALGSFGTAIQQAPALFKILYQPATLDGQSNGINSISSTLAAIILTFQSNVANILIPFKARTLFKPGLTVLIFSTAVNLIQACLIQSRPKIGPLAMNN